MALNDPVNDPAKNPPPQDPPKDPPAKDPPKDPPSNDDPPKDPPSSEDWRDLVATGAPEESRKKFRASLDKLSSPADIGRELLTLRKGINEKPSGIKPLTENSTDEEKVAYAKALGWPGDTEGYGYKRPDHLDKTLPVEVLEQTEKRWLEFANEARLPKEVANATLDFYYKELEGEAASRAKRADEDAAKTEAALKQEYGKDYEENINYAKAYAMAFAGSEAEAENIMNLELADGRRIGDLGPVVRAFVNAGRRLLPEGELLAATLSEDKRADVLTQIDEITKRTKDDGTYTNPSVQDKLRKLYEVAYGTKPVDR